METTDTAVPQDGDPTAGWTPREARHLINKFEAWYQTNRHRYTLARQADLDGLLDVAVTPDHAWALAHLGRRWLADADGVATQIEAVAEADEVARLAALDEAFPVDAAPDIRGADVRPVATATRSRGRVAAPGLFTAADGADPDARV